MEDRLQRIRAKIALAGLRLNPCLDLATVESFERKHGIFLPDAYRLFLLHVGDGGEGPPGYGVAPLSAGPLSSDAREVGYWQELPDVRKPFPFSKPWVWERGESTSQGTAEQVRHGSIYIGEEGCGEDWHLIVTGPERGHIWNFSWAGILPVVPKQDFAEWYERWLGRLPDWIWGSAVSAAAESALCPACGSEMERRVSPGGPFWGCGNYPRCRAIRRIVTGEQAEQINGLESQ